MDNKPLSVTFFGPSGAGKGTQAKLLKEYLEKETGRRALYMETGGLLREFMKKPGHTSKLVKDTLDVGGLLPSFVPIYVVAEELVREYTGEEHLIFDGVIRRDPQMVVFDNMLHFYNRAPYHVVSIELPPETVVERLKGRGRYDDDPERILKRLEWYNETTKPLLEKFKEFDCTVHTIDGCPSVEEVHQAILKELKLI